MKLLLISDTHMGITKPNSITKMLRKIRDEEQYDVVLHCGDMNGGATSWKPVRATVKMMREILGDVPLIVTSSNHDLWAAGTKFKSVYGGYGHRHPSYETWLKNYERCKLAYAAYGVHFLDEDGPFIHPEHPNIIIVGHGGWYGCAMPPTNDIGYLPLNTPTGQGTHAWLLTRAEKMLGDSLDKLDLMYDNRIHTVCFASHFPVVKLSDDYKGRWEDFSWREGVGEHMRAAYNCKYFFEGHSHTRREGKEGVYNCGSDYCAPNYLIVNVE